MTSTGRAVVSTDTLQGLRPGRNRQLTVDLGVGLSSAAVLVFEIVLARVFAVTQFYHFAFVTVSLALLGFGASGSVLAAFPRLGRGGPKRWAVLAALQAVTTLGAYAVTNALPFDSFSIAWDRRQVVYLVVYYLVLGLPFFFGGAVVGALLSGWDQPRPRPPSRVYGASLVGAGAGCLLAIVGVSWLGAVQMIVLAALCAGAGALAFLWREETRSRGALVITIVTLVLLGILSVSPPDALDLKLSPYKDLSAVLRYPGAETLVTDWNAASRIDLVRSEGIRSLPGLSFTFRGDLPPQDGVTFDGDDLSPIPKLSPDEADFVPYLLNSLPFLLREGGETLILEPRGGLDVLIAVRAGSRSVVAVEPNELAVEAAMVSGAVYDAPQVAVVFDDPRAYVERTDRTYDVIDLALTAPYRPVTSGAYSLAEDYDLTVEAFESYLARLRPGGLFTAMRWLQTPPSEEMRLLSLSAEALRRIGANPTGSIIGVRGYASAMVMVKPDGFSDEELAAVRSFVDERRFDLFAAPGLLSGESNRYNQLPTDDYYQLARTLLTASDPSSLYDAYAFDISPPTDDHPFFGHFFKWSQASDVWAQLGRTWQPFGGAGYFVLLALLILAAVVAVVLILAPLAVRFRMRHHASRRVRWWTVGYFGLLGIGFLFVEIPIFQQYILLLGRPVLSLAVVLFVLLVAAGLGSLASDRIAWRPAAVVLTVALILYPWLLRQLTERVLPGPLWARIVAGGLALIPLGFLMGTMLPHGLSYLRERWAPLVPWAWGINGAASVISAAAAALLALTFGFSVVVTLGAVCYGFCALLAR
ncbi:MAG: hypothetical protein ACE5MI_00540 [Acidimicrobiia bacterium]